MSKAVKKSTAPLFINYGANVSYNEPDTLPMTKDWALENLSYETKYSTGKFEAGNIVCEMIPIGFFYKDESGQIVKGDVKQSDLVSMLTLQSMIQEGDVPPVNLSAAKPVRVEKDGASRPSKSSRGFLRACKCPAKLRV